MRAGSRGRVVVTTGVVVVLAGATSYESSVALRALPIGTVPGGGAPGAGAVGVIAVVALLAGAVVSFAGTRTVGWLAGAPGQLLPLAGGAFVVASGLGFDPYYAPSHVRYHENSGIPPISWLVVLGCSAVASSLLIRFRPRMGAPVTVLLMLACLATFIFTGSGH